MNRIKDKIEEIEKYLSELNEIIPQNAKNYTNSILEKAACERYIEKIIEAIIDLAFILIKEKKFEIPKDDIHSFDILSNNKVISESLHNRLKKVKGMRNIIIHQYEKIDDDLVYNVIKNNLFNDVDEYLNSIKKYIN